MSVLIGILNRRQQTLQGVVTTSEVIPQILRLGDRRSVYPTVFWNKGKTFFSGDYPNTGGFNNQILAVQIDHNANNYISTSPVGKGTSFIDGLNHPVPFTFLENDYIYMGQTDPHNEPIKIYKTNSSNDIKSGFSLAKTILGDNAYPQPFNMPDGKVAFCVRLWEESGNNIFNTAILKSDAGIEGNYTKIPITQGADNDLRHYNGSAIISGTSNYRYISVFPRKSSAGNAYFAQAWLRTTDGINYENIAGTFTKDVTVDPITVAELEAHYIYNGSYNNQDINFKLSGPSRQINDECFIINTKEGTTDFYVFKASGNTITSHIVNVSNLFSKPNLYDNGRNLLLSCEIDDGVDRFKKIYTISEDLTIFTEVFSYANPKDLGSRAILLPDNLEKVSGVYGFYIDYDTDNDTAVFGLTEDKFYI